MSDSSDPGGSASDAGAGDLRYGAGPGASDAGAGAQHHPLKAAQSEMLEAIATARAAVAESVRQAGEANRAGSLEALEAIRRSQRAMAESLAQAPVHGGSASAEQTAATSDATLAISAVARAADDALAAARMAEEQCMLAAQQGVSNALAATASK